MSFCLRPNATIAFFVIKETFLGKGVLIPSGEQRRKIYELVHPRLIVTSHASAQMGQEWPNVLEHHAFVRQGHCQQSKVTVAVIQEGEQQPRPEENVVLQ